MTEPKWPEKKYWIGKITQKQDSTLEYRNGWNACHESFMKAKEAQPSGLVPLDKDEVIYAIIENEYGSNYTELSDFPIKTRQEILHRATFICSTFGTTPKAEVMSVEDIKSILDNCNSESVISNSDRQDIAQAIHQRLTQREIK